MQKIRWHWQGALARHPQCRNRSPCVSEAPQTGCASRSCSCKCRHQRLKMYCTAKQGWRLQPRKVRRRWCSRCPRCSRCWNGSLRMRWNTQRQRKPWLREAEQCQWNAEARRASKQESAAEAQKISSERWRTCPTQASEWQCQARTSAVRCQERHAWVDKGPRQQWGSQSSMAWCHS